MNALLIILLALTFSAFFSGLEIAFLSLNRLRLELKNQQGLYWAKLVSGHEKKPSSFISTILVGNNISMVVYSIFMEESLSNIFHLSYLGNLLVITSISTIIVLVFAEFIPKALFRINPGKILSILIYPFQLLYFILWPMVAFSLWFSKLILRLVLGKKFTEKSKVFTKVDLDHFMSEGTINDSEDNKEVDAEVFKNALEFSELKVKECMVPRTILTAVEMLESIETLKQTFIESNHSKVLIYNDNIDNIVGYVHQTDMLENPTDIQSVLRNISITNLTRPAGKVLKELASKKSSIALVVDEFGGTAGIITLEDILEEILGEIKDEHDDDEGIVEKQLNENEFVFSALIEIDHINENYDLELEEGDYETLGGYIINHSEKIPETGEIIQIKDYQFNILKAEEQKIILVKIIKEIL